MEIRNWEDGEEIKIYMSNKNFLIIMMFLFIFITAGCISVDNEKNKTENKEKLIKEADKKIAEIEKNFNQGLITDEERKRLKNNVWIETTENLVDLTWKLFDRDNSAKIIINDICKSPRA